jgi:hypothetical protein
MPDLGLIKQAKQERGTGVGGFEGAVGPTPPAGRAATATTSPARLLPASDAAALR